jgi:hypothetical protein
VLQSVLQDKWEKARSQIGEISAGFALIDEGIVNNFNYKRLEQIRGFLCHISMTYPLVTPYLKGLNLTLAAYHPGIDESGWKMLNQEWSAYLHEAVESGKLMGDKVQALEAFGDDSNLQESSPSRPPINVPVPPKRICPVPRLKGDTCALATLFSKMTPAQTLVRASRVYTILYVFADASGSGFGSTVLGNDRIRYHIGTWDLDTQDSSSTFREFENVVEALKAEAC